MSNNPNSKNPAPSINWEIGTRGRTKGAIHRDMCTISASELAEMNQIAIFPRNGWRKLRKDCSQKERYSLIVSLETDDPKMDLYTHIMNIIQPETWIGIT